MWTYLLTVYFMHNKNENGELNEEKFYLFLEKIIAFIWGYALVHPGVNALRTPAYPEMINIIDGLPVEFKDYKFEIEKVQNSLDNYSFTNGRPITKSMLAWWAFHNENQKLLKLDTKLQIEHIFARKRQENEKSLKDKNNLESLDHLSVLTETLSTKELFKRCRL